MSSIEKAVKRNHEIYWWKIVALKHCIACNIDDEAEIHLPFTTWRTYRPLSDFIVANHGNVPPPSYVYVALTLENEEYTFVWNPKDDFVKDGVCLRLKVRIKLLFIPDELLPMIQDLSHDMIFQKN